MLGDCSITSFNAELKIKQFSLGKQHFFFLEVFYNANLFFTAFASCSCSEYTLVSSLSIKRKIESLNKEICPSVRMSVHIFLQLPLSLLSILLYKPLRMELHTLPCHTHISKSMFAEVK